MIFIDGILFQNQSTPSIPDPVPSNVTLTSSGATACQQTNAVNQAFVGATVYTMDDTDTVITGATIIVQNGIVTCVSNVTGACPNPDASYNVYNLQGGCIIPGGIVVHSGLAQIEVPSEENSGSGVQGADNLYATDNLMLNMFYNQHLIVKKPAFSDFTGF